MGGKNCAECAKKPLRWSACLPVCHDNFKVPDHQAGIVMILIGMQFRIKILWVCLLQQAALVLVLLA